MSSYEIYFTVILRKVKVFIRKGFMGVDEVWLLK